MISNSTKLTSFFTSNKIQVSNIGEVPAGGTFRIIVNGITNPNYGSVMSTWYADVNYNEFSLISHPNFYSLSLENAGIYEILNLTKMDVFPTNAAVYATYILTVQPTVKLSLGSKVEVQFPTQYKVIPSAPECSVDGGIKTFTSCTQEVNSIVFTLDNDYEVTQGPIILTIFDILNPDRGTTDSFEILTTYDGNILERTDPNNVTARKLVIENKPNDIVVLSTDFDPQNEGEISTYTISFLPVIDIDINQEIVFIFPRTFDQILGNKLQCTATSGLADEISCTRLENRILHIDGITSYQVSPDRPITIKIGGIINPNKLGSTSQPIGLGILKIGRTVLIDYSASALSFTPIKAPGWAFFYSFNTTNTHCRYTADYTFNFTAASSIPKLSSIGAIILDLPKQFGISEKITSCTSYTPNYGTALNCEITNNRVWITGNTNDYSGNVVVKVRKVNNPIDKTQSDNFIVSTYDGINKKVIERSYQNLDPFFFAYNYPGPRIIVNEDKPIIVMRGTQTHLIPMWIENIAALNLTIKPVMTGINILPYYVDIQIGQPVRYFRVTCPSDLSLGNYTIDWIIEGELVPPIYTPIKTTQVQVIQSTIMDVTIDKISDIPFGGTSLPVFLKIPMAPDIGFDIILNFKKNYAGISLSTDKVSFSAGVTEAQFRVYFSNYTAAQKESITQGSIDLQVSGVNQALYQMPFSSMLFNIITQDATTPKITLTTLNAVNKTLINVTVECSEPSYVYYMVALQGTKTPTAKTLAAKAEEQVKLRSGSAGNSTSTNTTGGSNSTNTTGNSTTNGTNDIDYYQTSTRSIFNASYIFDSLTTNLIVEKLNPQLSYTLFICLQNKGGSYSAVTTLNFTTQDRDSAADVSIRLKQSYISPYDINRYLRSIALVLSLEPSKVLQSKYDFTSSSRLLAPISGSGLETINTSIIQGSTTIDKVTSLLSFNLIGDIVTEVYPTPKVLGELLNNKSTELQARIDNFDSSYIIPSTAFLKYLPNFVSVPTMYDYNYAHAVISCKMDNFGWLYAVAIERNSSSRSNNAPTPLQVSLGLDSQNLPVPNGAIEISAKYRFFYLYVGNLKPLTPYTIYAVGANAQPGYPDLMDENFMREITFTTKAAPALEVLDLTSRLISASFTSLCLVLFLAF